MNKTSQNYFMNLLIRKKKVIALYTFICFMAYPFLLITDWITNNRNNMAGITLSAFYMALITLALLAIILPIFTFKFSIVKRNVDMYFSIPINRNHLFNAHFIAPILGACLPIFINYLIGGLLIIPSNGIKTYLILLFLLLIAFMLFIVIYSINTFFVLKCNNVIDASIISISLIIVPLLLYGALSSFLYSQMVPVGMRIDFISDLPLYVLRLIFPYYGFISLGETISINIRTISTHLAEFNWGYFIYYFIIGFIFIILAKKSFKKKRGEDAEQLTTNYLTYPLFTKIGIFSLFLMFNFSNYDDITSILLTVIILFVIYVIINGIASRSMKVSKKTVFEFILILFLVNGFNYFSKSTEFFGLNRKTIDYMKYDTVNIIYTEYDYSSSVDKELLDYNEIFKISDLTQEQKALLDYLEIIQKEKSLAYRENNYELIYPNYGNNNYFLEISYTRINDDHSQDSQYVQYYLTRENTQVIRQLIQNIEE